MLTFFFYAYCKTIIIQEKVLICAQYLLVYNTRANMNNRKEVKQQHVVTYSYIICRTWVTHTLEQTFAKTWHWGKC